MSSERHQPTTRFINPDNVRVCAVTCGESCKFCRPSLTKIWCVVRNDFLCYTYRLWRRDELRGWRSGLQLHVGRKPKISQVDLLPLKIWGFYCSADCYTDLWSRRRVAAYRAMKSVEGSRSTAPLVISVLEWCEWPTSRPDRFSPREEPWAVSFV